MALKKLKIQPSKINYSLYTIHLSLNRSFANHPLMIRPLPACDPQMVRIWLGSDSLMLRLYRADKKRIICKSDTKLLQVNMKRI